MKLKRNINAVARYLVLIVVGFFMLYPLLWMIGGIFKSNTEIFTSAAFWPKEVLNGWEAIKKGWMTNTPYHLGQYFLNTMRFLIPRVMVQVVSCVITAYVISRRQFKFKKIVFGLVITTLLMPDVIYRIPLYLLWRDLNLLNTYIPLWLDNAFATNSFFIFMLVQFMRTIPRELDEASLMDGCNSFQTLIYILVPVMVPSIITVSLLTFMWGMNDFLGPLIYLTDIVKYPLSLALRMAADNKDSTVEWRNVFAMTTIALIPSLLLFFSAQKHFIEGIATTGSKE